jgi:hypothetical protein
LLDNNLGLTLNYLSSYSNVAPVTHPGTVTSYRLYPGGKQYSVPRIQDTYGSTLSNASLGPDPILNPLGVFRSSGSLSLADNAHIKGSLIAESSSPLVVSGSNIVLEGSDMPELRGATTPVQLPSLLSSDTVRIASSSQSQITGIAVAWSPVLIEAGTVSTSLSFQGRLLAYDLDFGRRTNWSTNNGYWTSGLNAFEGQQSSWTYGLSSWFFPTYLKARDALPYEPQLQIKGPASPVAYQWQDWSQPIYVKADQDPGLRWELISWRESR